MVSTGSLRLSSVVPATATCEQNRVHELTNMDLAMKLHYIKGVYLFNGEAVEGFTIDDFKTPMFQLLQLYYTASGRVRRSETGRPFIKSNDSGVRIAESYCEETVEEWLDMAMEDSSLFDGLAYNQPLGPDLGFCPLVFLQFTWFKCGGLSVGLSWANVLGDAFSASAFINTWAKIMAGLVRQEPLHVPPPTNQELPSISSPKSPFSLKRVDPVGDYWLTPNTCKMRKHTFHVPAKKIDQYFLSNQTANNKAPAFEVLCALIWKFMSKIKENPDQTKIVTICTNSHDREFEFPSNGMVWSTVEADFLVAEADVADLVEVILQKRAEENGGITEIVGRESGQSGESDFIAYGAKLTFVKLEEADIYGLELKGQKPVFANYWINGVGDEGVVLVLPAPKYSKDENSGGVGGGGGGGRLVTVVLPENQLEQLKRELQSWSIA